MKFGKKNKDKNIDSVEEVAEEKTAVEEADDEVSATDDETSATDECVDEINDDAVQEDASVDDSVEDKEVDKLIKKADKKEAKRKKKAEKKKLKEQKEEDKKKEDVNIVKELLSLIFYIGIVVLLCFLVINFVGCRSKVDGDSMYPTLHDNDNLWVDKLSYTFGEPKRFDVIIFDYDDNTTFVKRIIGLPGETVRIDTDGVIYINNVPLEEDYGYEPIRANNLGRASADVILGEDEYFVLGDNRNNSRDSRFADVGNINIDDIDGKVVLRIYPFSSFGPVD